MTAVDKKVERLSSATVRFAGDSGDGMQLAGMQFTDTSAIFGNDVATLPDYPAEIRAPAGTVAGVSGFQINFASNDIHTPGDQVDALIAMNPAALKANIEDVRSGGAVLVNESEFNKVNLRKAGYSEDQNPLEDEELRTRYQFLPVPITRMTEESLADSGMSTKDIGRCKNMYALGVVFWLYDRPLEPTIHFLNDFFGKKKSKPEVAAANVKALQAGYHFGETAELFVHRYQVEKADIPPGKYRRVTGNEAMSMGLVTAATLANKDLVYASYPITPASDILHNLAAMKNYGVKTIQAEDEIAACCAAIGASYAGQIGCTGTSGPGICLKSEAIGLAVMTELPMVIVNVQRGGPSTGLPTKVEQADLLQAMFGRNGESPAVILSPRSPSDCFNIAIEAVRLAFQAMAPVLILSDGYMANGAEPWRLPDPSKFEPIDLPPAPQVDPDKPFQPYARDENLRRPWVAPGTAGFEHRIGGLEKQHLTGNVAYQPANHQLMCNLRAEKINRITRFIGDQPVEGPESGDLLLVSWGGTYGAVTTAAMHARDKGKSVAVCHLRHLNPFPANLGDIIQRYKQVLVPELNNGQLRMLLRDKFLVDARGLNKMQGQPFLVDEVTQAIDLMLEGRWGDAMSLIPEGHEVKPAGSAA